MGGGLGGRVGGGGGEEEGGGSRSAVGLLDIVSLNFDSGTDEIAKTCVNRNARYISSGAPLNGAFSLTAKYVPR